MSRIFSKLFVHPQWFIAYRARKPFSFPYDSTGFTVIEPAPGRFFADPFVIEYKNRNYLLFEEYLFEKAKGVVSFVEIDAEGFHSKPMMILERDYHLSYPFIFRWNGRIYMIPETVANSSIELYSTDDFPYGWKLEHKLMEGVKAHDTTLWFSEHEIWMFTIIDATGEPYSELSIFYADSLFGKWMPHAKNPVVSDKSRARPAGNLFFHQGSLIRPGQNSIERYGHSLTFNQIVSLTKDSYHEIAVSQITPDWYPGNLCTHTYNFNDSIEAIDGLLPRTDWLKPYRKFVSKIK
jgi:hypothetical protein